MILPQQLLSKKEKLRRDERTNKNNIEETIDYYISQCNWATYTEEIRKLYNAVEGIIDIQEYRYTQNPFNITMDNGELPTYAAKLKNFNILKGIANLLIGEFSRRSHEYVVFDFNPSDEIAKKDALALALKDYYSQALVNDLATRIPGIGEQKELPPLEEYVNDFNKTFDDIRVIRGQDALDYLRYNCKLDAKYTDLYWDWIVTGGAYTFKTVRNNDIIFELVSSNELFVPFNKQSRFVEDAPYVVRRQNVPISYILDFFKGKIDEEMMIKLDNVISKGLTSEFTNISYMGRNGLITSNTSSINYGTSVPGHSLIYDKFNGIELYHVQYKTYEEYQILTYIDAVGNQLEMEVGSDYVLQPELGDISIYKAYKNVLMEGYKVLDFYLDVKEIDFDRSDFNGGNQKFSYNGIRERSYSGEIQSIIKEGISYQIAINTMFYQLEKLINKNKDKLLIMPKGLVSGKKGMTTKQTMYHADATSILWIDETAANASYAAQMIKSVDMGLGNYVSNSIELIRYYKAAYWESIGMNAQRYSDISQGAGKAVTEQAIIRSAVITQELTRQFEMLIESDYMGLLDLSKYAWINGKKSKYITSDGSIAFLNLNEDDAIYHTESEYGVFVKDASLNTEAIQAVRGQAQALIQNGAPAQMLSSLYSTNNLSKMNDILSKLEENKREYQLLLQKQAQEANEALQDSKNINDEANREIKRYVADMAYNAAVDAAEVRASNVNNNNEPRPVTDLENRLADHKINNDNKKTEILEKSLQIKKNTNK